MRRLPEVRGEGAKKVGGGREARARAGRGQGREARTGTGTRARARGCAAPTVAGLLRCLGALPRGPPEPGEPALRGEKPPPPPPPPGPGLPGRAGRASPAPRGERRGGAAASGDCGRVRASKGWGAARGAERPGSLSPRAAGPLPRRPRLVPAPGAWWGRRAEEELRARDMEPREPGAGRPETRPTLRPGAAGSPR